MTRPLILNIGSGNLLSLKNIISKKNSNLLISCKDEDIDKSTHIFLPGVGSYGDVINKLKHNVNLKLLNKKILKDKIFFLGICVGMQILSDEGSENGVFKGLSWIKGKVNKLPTKEILPHVGWNSIKIKLNDKILNGVPNLSDFYFTHSYCFKSSNIENEIAETDYGVNFPSIIKNQNIYGTQFHPEKSQIAGVKLIENFLNLK